MKAQEHAEDLSRNLEAVKNDQRNHQFKLDEVVASHGKELEAANAKVAEAEQRLQALTRSNNLQLESVKKRSAVCTICSLVTAPMLSNFSQAIS